MAGSRKFREIPTNLDWVREMGGWYTWSMPGRYAEPGTRVDIREYVDRVWTLIVNHRGERLVEIEHPTLKQAKEHALSTVQIIIDFENNRTQ